MTLHDRDLAGLQINTLCELEIAADNHYSVVVPRSTTWNKPKPAAFMIHLSGVILLRCFKSGMYCCKKGNK